MGAAPFEPLGQMSVTDACQEIIRELAEGDGISKPVCLAEVRDRTGRDTVDMHAVLQGMREASERLLDAGQPGVVAIRGSGWQRMKPADVVGYIRARQRRATVQTSRSWRAVDVVTDTGALGWQDRETLRLTAEARRRQDELSARRGARKRPLAAGDADEQTG